MTSNEMKQQVLILVDKFYEYGAPGYDDNSISKVLTEAQRRVLKRILPRFESSEETSKALEQYIKNASVGDGTISQSSNQTGVHTNGTFYDMPSDFYLAIEERCDTATTSDINVKPVKHDFYTKNKSNPYKKPNTTTGSEVFWRMNFSRETHAVGVTAASAKRVEIISDGSVITNYNVRYIVNPPNIVVDTITTSNQVHSILDEQVHYDIVREAAKILTGAVEPEEYPIASKEEEENRN